MTVLAKLALLSSAAASSFSVSSWLGAPFSSAAISPLTNAVVASCVVFVPPAAVGAAGVPVNVGEAIAAFRAIAAAYASYAAF